MAASPPRHRRTSPSYDLDDDGIPDEWERAHGLNPNDRADASLDGDHDGSTNLDEYRADTDPVDPGSVFRIHAIRLMGEVELSLPTSASRTYTLQSQDVLGDSSWNDVPGQTRVRGNGEILILRDSVKPDTRFDRVWAEIS